MLFIRGALVHAPVWGEVEVLEDRLIGVAEGGVIAAIVPGDQEAELLATHDGKPEDVLRLRERQFILPGFIDLHIHAPQYVFTGTNTDVNLMQWLPNTAFPTERRFGQDLAFARHAYSRLISRLISLGTTTALLFATLHQEPSRLLADLLEEAGMRAYVGKVSVDRNMPESYNEGATEEALASAESFIRYVQSKGLSRLQPAVCPRFLPTCSSELLHGLGELAARYDTVVTSHIREGYDEEAASGALECAGGSSEAELFDAAGLLTSKAVYAHGVLLTESELSLLAARGSSIAHCAHSNFFFADCILPLAQVLRSGVKVGLGSDVAGGYSPSMLHAMRSAVVASWALHAQRIAAASRSAELALQYQREGDPDLLSWKHALWLATVGGAQALGLQDRLGSLEVGKDFDALLICSDGQNVSQGGSSTRTASASPYDVFDGDTIVHQVEKFVNLGDDRNIAEVWVQGRPIKCRFKVATAAPATAAGDGAGAED